MSSNGYGTALHLELGQSRHFTVLVILMYAGSLAATLLLPLEWWIKVLSGTGLMASLVHCLRYHTLLLSENAVVRMKWGLDDEWSLQTRSGKIYRADLTQDCYVTPALVILNFRIGNQWRKRGVALFPDGVPEDSFRRLRVRLQLR